MLPSSDGPEADRSKLLRRWGPLAVIAVVAVIVVAVLVVGGGGYDDDDTADGGGGNGSGSVTEAEGPDGAVSCTRPRRPAHRRPRLARHVRPRDGPGRHPVPAARPSATPTSRATTAGPPPTASPRTPSRSSPTWRSEDDPILDYITAAIANDDTCAQAGETIQGYAELFNDYYQTYGRTVELESSRARGPANDEVAARADAVQGRRGARRLRRLGRPGPHQRLRRRARRPGA